MNFGKDEAGDARQDIYIYIICNVDFRGLPYPKPPFLNLSYPSISLKVFLIRGRLLLFAPGT
jgi:hypothetical protein